MRKALATVPCPVLRNVMGSRVSRQAPAPPWSPITLFNEGVQGVWFDPSDISTLFQDVEGTIPVTAPDQAVALILDKSGNENHAMQSTSSSRPLYKIDGGLPYLYFDGIDDSLSTTLTDFTSTDKVTMFSGTRHLKSDALSELLALSSDPVNNTGVFGVVCTNATANIGVRGRGTTGGLVSSGTTGNAYPAPSSNVTTGIVDIGAAERIVRVDSEQVAMGTGTLGTGTFSQAPIYIGSRGGTSARFYGNVYGIVIVGNRSTVSQIAQAENYMASKTGINI